jgi:hypothetical protein
MKTILKMSFVGIALMFLLIKPDLSYAWDHHGGWHGHDRDWHHHSSFSLGIGFGFPAYYEYDSPYYYPYRTTTYVVTPPPPTVVTSIPADYEIVSVNGVTYYVSNGAYYIYNGYGYQLVSPPVTPTTTVTNLAPPAEVNAPNEGNQQNVFTINIPNDEGNYTPVTLKRSGNGFVGPQGEFYNEFPSIAQLKLMYGRKK